MKRYLVHIYIIIIAILAVFSRIKTNKPEKKTPHCQEEAERTRMRAEEQAERVMRKSAVATRSIAEAEIQRK